MGVGYIIGPKIAGVLVAGGVLSWFVFTPLLASLMNDNGDVIAAQLVKLGYLKDLKYGRRSWWMGSGDTWFCRLVAGYLPGLYPADWCRCSCSRWFYYIDQNNSHYHFFF